MFNFLIILFLLKKFAFKPIGKIIKERQDKIDKGLQKAAEADIRLKEVDVIAKNIIKKADVSALEIIKNAEEKAKKIEADYIQKIEKQYAQMARRSEEEFENRRREVLRNLFKEAAQLVRMAIVKTVELNPRNIDESAINKAVSYINKKN